MSQNKFYLVKFSKDVHGSLTVDSLSVCDSVRLEHEQLIVKVNAEYIFQEIAVGTNESFYDMHMDELFESYTFIEISDVTYNELKHQLINTWSEGYGTWFSWPSTLLEQNQEREEE